MIKKGIILAGGIGARMSPLTKAVNKQLLPIYNKPLIFYPLSILMLAKIKDVLIIVNKGDLDQYKKLLPNGNNLGIKITYKEQNKPRGLPDAFILGENFIGKNNVAMILGDNFFYGQNLTNRLKQTVKLKNGAISVPPRALVKLSFDYMFSGAERLNVRNCQILSNDQTPDADTVFRSFNSNQSNKINVIYAHPVMATINNGQPLHTLQQAINRGVDVRFVSYTSNLPDTVTDLSVEEKI